MQKILAITLCLFLTACPRAYEYKRTSAGKCSLSIYSFSDVSMASISVDENCAVKGKAEGVSNAKAFEVLDGIIQKIP